MLSQGVLAEDLSTTFSLNSMRIFLDLYFMHFAPLHPILHQPTLALRPGGISPYLLAAVCCIGSAYAEEKSGWKAAVRLSKRLRNRILEIVEENPRIDMDMLKVRHLMTLALRCVQALTAHSLPVRTDFDARQLVRSLLLLGYPARRLSGASSPSLYRPIVQD